MAQHKVKVSASFILFLLFAIFGLPYVLNTWLVHFDRSPVQLAWWFRFIIVLGFGYGMPTFPVISFQPTHMMSLLWVGTYIATLFGF